MHIYYESGMFNVIAWVPHTIVIDLTNVMMLTTAMNRFIEFGINWTKYYIWKTKEYNDVGLILWRPQLEFGMATFGENEHVGSHSPHILFESDSPCQNLPKQFPFIFWIGGGHTLGSAWFREAMYSTQLWQK